MEHVFGPLANVLWVLGFAEDRRAFVLGERESALLLAVSAHSKNVVCDTRWSGMPCDRAAKPDFIFIDTTLVHKGEVTKAASDFLVALNQIERPDFPILILFGPNPLWVRNLLKVRASSRAVWLFRAFARGFKARVRSNVFESTYYLDSNPESPHSLIPAVTRCIVAYENAVRSNSTRQRVRRVLAMFGLGAILYAGRIKVIRI